jgi:hypothetical protein
MVQNIPKCLARTPATKAANVTVPQTVAAPAAFAILSRKLSSSDNANVSYFNGRSFEKVHVI